MPSCSRGAEHLGEKVVGLDRRQGHEMESEERRNQRVQRLLLLRERQRNPKHSKASNRPSLQTPHHQRHCHRSCFPTCNRPRSAAASPASRSTMALFIHTRAVEAGGCSRALARISLCGRAGV